MLISHLQLDYLIEGPNVRLYHIVIIYFYKIILLNYHEPEIARAFIMRQTPSSPTLSAGQAVEQVIARHHGDG